jgi:hypothetical protein
MLACAASMALPACDLGSLGGGIDWTGPNYVCNGYLLGLTADRPATLEMRVGEQFEIVVQSGIPAQAGPQHKECPPRDLPRFFPTIEWYYATASTPFEVVGVDGPTGLLPVRPDSFFTRTIATMSGPGPVRIALRGVRPGVATLNIYGHTESPTQDASGLFFVYSFQTAPVWLQFRVLP